MYERHVIEWIGTGVLIALVVWSLWRLMRISDRIHGDLAEIKRRASECETPEELEDVEVTLRLYAAKNCWHRHHGSHAREVLAYIHGRKR